MKQDKAAIARVKEFVCAYWRESTDREMAVVLGVPIPTVQSVRQRLGLKKESKPRIEKYQLPTLEGMYRRARLKLNREIPLSEAEQAALDKMKGYSPVDSG
jgi:hypothetical protein